MLLLGVVICLPMFGGLSPPQTATFRAEMCRAERGTHVGRVGTRVARWNDTARAGEGRLGS